MSLEMIANPRFGLGNEDRDAVRDSLHILDRCNVTDRAEASYDVFPRSSYELRKELLTAATNELRKGRRRLTLWRIIWATFWHRDERGVLQPYWRLRERQRPHDAARVAELLVSVRQRLNEQEHGCTREELRHVRKDRRRAKRALHITAAITGDVTEIEETLNPKTQDAPKSDQTERRPDANAEKTQQRTPGVPKGGQPEWRPGEKAGKTRWLPWQHRTPSWQAAYNAACLYAALACSDEACSDEDRQSKMARMAVRCLQRAVNDRNCEMERPWDWISTDPDLRSLRCCPPDFSKFLAEQKQKDYPDADPDSDQNWHWVRCDGGRTCVPRSHCARQLPAAASPNLGQTTTRQSSRPAFRRS